MATGDVLCLAVAVAFVSIFAAVIEGLSIRRGYLLAIDYLDQMTRSGRYTADEAIRKLREELND